MDSPEVSRRPWADAILKMRDCGDVPLVSIGIPTFNRVPVLERAVLSVLNQDFPRLELVISDNASTDSTESLCRRYASADQRIRYVRQASNLGPIQNFTEVLRLSSGEFFMWLSDDDWLDRSYVRACLETILADPRCSIVGGLAKYYQGERVERVGSPVNLRSTSPLWRMLRYYAGVTDNAIFYGLMRRTDAVASPLRNLAGCDWLFVSGLAFQGRARTIECVCIHRDIGGLSANRRFSFVAIAANAFSDVFLHSGVYASLARPARLSMACLVFVHIVVYKCVLPKPLAFSVRILQKLFGKDLYRLILERLRG